MTLLDGILYFLSKFKFMKFEWLEELFFTYDPTFFLILPNCKSKGSWIYCERGRNYDAFEPLSSGGLRENYLAISENVIFFYFGIYKIY